MNIDSPPISCNLQNKTAFSSRFVRLTVFCVIFIWPPTCCFAEKLFEKEFRSGFLVPEGSCDITSVTEDYDGRDDRRYYGGGNNIRRTEIF